MAARKRTNKSKPFDGPQSYDATPTGTVATIRSGSNGSKPRRCWKLKVETVIPGYSLVEEAGSNSFDLIPALASLSANEARAIRQTGQQAKLRLQVTTSAAGFYIRLNQAGGGRPPIPGYSFMERERALDEIRKSADRLTELARMYDRLRWMAEKDCSDAFISLALSAGKMTESALSQTATLLEILFEIDQKNSKC